MPRPGPANAGHSALNLIAKGVHFLLDAGLIGMFNEANIPGVYRGESAFPQDFYAQSLRELHGAVGYTLLLLIIMHFSAAMYHKFIRRDNLLSRMWFGKT